MLPSFIGLSEQDTKPAVLRSAELAVSVCGRLQRILATIADKERAPKWVMPDFPRSHFRIPSCPHLQVLRPENYKHLEPILS